MKKTTTILLFLIIGISYAFSQDTYSILYGDVKSKADGKHIPHATITVKGTNLRTKCDDRGHFILSDIPAGTHTVVASHDGFSEQEMELLMEQNKRTGAFFLLEEDALELNQVVVTGTRTQHYLKNVPIRTEVLTSQAITNKNAQNLFEALEGVAGVRVEQQCQACNFSMVRMQGLGAEHTQVLIDGEPIYSGLAGVYGLQQIGTNDIDRLEIVKGAGSALYGSSAVAGAINIITKEPTFKPYVNADVQFGNWGHKTYNASAGMRRNKIGVNIFAQRLEADAVDKTQDGMTRSEVKHKDGISDRVKSQLNNIGMGLYFFSPLAQSDKLTLRVKAMEEFRAGGILVDDTYLNPYTEGTENIKTNRLSADMNYTLPIGSKSTFNIAAAYVYHKRNATNDTFLRSYKDSHDGENPSVDIMRPYLAKEKTFTPSMSFTTTMGSHTLLLGAQGSFTRLRESGLYCIDDEENTEYYGTAYTSLSKKHANEIGFFVQDEWTNVLPGLTVVPGMRLDIHKSGEEYDSDEKVFNGTFPKTNFEKTVVAPRLAIKYDIDPKLVLRANFGTGFRAPYGFSEDLHLCSGSPRVWKSSTLNGERAISLNLSADYYGKNVQVSLNLFRTNLYDKIEFSSADENIKKLGYTYQWQNIDDAYVQGIEIGTKIKIARNMKTGINWTLNQGKYNHARNDWKGTEYENDSRFISRFPMMTGDISLDYTPGSWTFSMTGSLQGKMYIDYYAEDETNSKIKKTPTFMLFNCRIAKQLGNAFTVYTGGKNIFGYIQDEKHTDDAAFMYAPVFGATWYVGTSIKI